MCHMQLPRMLLCLDTRHTALGWNSELSWSSRLTPADLLLVGAMPHGISQATVSGDRSSAPSFAALRRDGASSSQTGRAVAEVHITRCSPRSAMLAQSGLVACNGTSRGNISRS